MTATEHPSPAEMAREDNGGPPAHENERIDDSGYAAGIAAERARVGARLRERARRVHLDVGDEARELHAVADSLTGERP